MPPIFKRKGAWVLVASFVVLGWAVHTAYRGLRARQEVVETSLLQVGDAMPNLPLPILGGGEARTGDFANQALVINFWAGWCAPCLKEMPSLYRLHERLQDKGVRVLAVAMDENPVDATRALAKIGGKPPFPIYLGFERPIFSRFPIEGLPYTVLVDAKGVIRYAEPGERDWADAESLRLVEALL